jgi:phenylpropionate dioxygenase-like ring-hydroxylating dioxygenase large terminal subunit
MSQSVHHYALHCMSNANNRCYHCPTTHPDIPAVANLDSYDVQTRAAQIIHDAATTEEQREKGLVIAASYYFPNVSTNITYVLISHYVDSC